MSQRTEQVRKDRAKYLITEYRQAMQKLKLYTPLIEAFEQANDFETTDIDHYGITIKPKQAALSAKELSILFDEIIFDLPFEPKREILTENELSIYFGDYPLTYCISITLKESTRCKVIELSSKARIYTSYDKTYAFVCNE